MGALLNQSMFLILIGIMKRKTVALIVQDFRNVSALPLLVGWFQVKANVMTGTVRAHL